MKNTQTKICTKCNKDKTLLDFYPKINGKFGKSSECKECFKLRIPSIRLKKKGIEPLNSNDEFIKTLQKQNYRCPICERKFNESIKPCIDHDHDTNKVRGIICTFCNSGLGFMNDNINTLLNAIVYLKVGVQEIDYCKNSKGKLRRTLIE